MAEQNKRQPQGFMSTHPSHEIRFRKLIEWMPKALEVRREHCGSL